MLQETILIVDDDSSIRMLLKAILDRDGYRFFEASNGQDTLEILKKEKIDLVILDLMMPVMSGFDTLKSMRKVPSLTIIPVIVLSAMSRSSDIEDCLKLGVADYFTKPLRHDDIRFLLPLKIKNLVKLKLTQEKLIEAERIAKYQKELERINILLQEKIKELEETQAQLVQSAKMASLGILAAGIAHEINNPNSFVNSNLQVFKTYIKNLKDFFHALEEFSLSSDNTAKLSAIKQKFQIDHIMDDLKNLVSDSLEGTDRIKSIVKDLKEFSRLDKPELEDYDLNDGIRSSLNMLRHEVKHGIKVIEEYGELPFIKCHPRQLNQVFMNLLINAIQALSGHGEIRIKTFEEHSWIVTIIEDNGCGISEANLGKIFDPFFTTKDVGKGMGLGLSLSYKIIKSHGGTIEVQSTTGKGTVFTVKIPVGP